MSLIVELLSIIQDLHLGFLAAFDSTPSRLRGRLLPNSSIRSYSGGTGRGHLWRLLVRKTWRRLNSSDFWVTYPSPSSLPRSSSPATAPYPVAVGRAAMRPTIAPAAPATRRRFQPQPRTIEQHSSHKPRLAAAAAWRAEAIRPSRADQIRPAGRLGGKSGFQFRRISRVFLHHACILPIAVT